MHPSAFSSLHLKELSATWPMTVSPLIHSPGLISASALENDPTLQDLTLGAWRSLPRRKMVSQGVEMLRGFRLFFHFLTVLTAPSPFSEPPAPQSARPSHHWVDGCSEPHITEQPRPFSESRSRLKSGGWAGETGTQPNQSFQEPRLCAAYARSEAADEMHCYSVRNATASETAKQKQNLGKRRNDFSPTNGWRLDLIRNKRTWEFFLVSSGSGPEKGLECVSGSRIKEGFFRATLETWGWGEDRWEPETQVKGWGSEDWQGGKGPRQQGPGGTAIWLWSRGLWKVSWCSERKARGFPVPGNRVNENLSLGHGFWNFP